MMVHHCNWEDSIANALRHHCCHRHATVEAIHNRESAIMQRIMTEPPKLGRKNTQMVHWLHSTVPAKQARGYMVVIIKLTC